MKKGLGFFDWGDESIYSSFFFHIDSIGKCMPYSSYDKGILFGDPECVKVHSFFLFPSPYNFYGKYAYSLFGYSFFDTKHHKQLPYSTKVDSCISFYYTGQWDEEDIIYGAEGKFKSLLSKIIKDNKRVYILRSCISNLVALDTQSISYSFCDLNKCNIFSDMNENPPPPLVTEHISVLKETKHHQMSKHRTNSVNLVGYLNNNYFKEMIILLGRGGITVNISLLPELPKKNNYDLTRAKVSFLNPSIDYGTQFDSLKRRKFLEPPYGFNKSKEFIDTILGMFNCKIKKPPLQEYISNKHKIWKSLQDQAKKHRIGFVITKDTSILITNPKERYDHLDIISILDEMGFSFEIMVLSNEEDYSKIRLKLYSMFRNPHQHKFAHINNPQEIGKFILGSSCSCFYSDLASDENILKNGKNIFSSSLLEPGFDGAINSLQGLLNICNTPFFRLYSEFLGENPSFENNLLPEAISYG